MTKAAQAGWGRVRGTAGGALAALAASGANCTVKVTPVCTLVHPVLGLRVLIHISGERGF